MREAEARATEGAPTQQATVHKIIIYVLCARNL